ncbi:MAG: hypothetical protein IKS75_03530 [Clostridiales bacterium]|nr:hypothetical protein [Clostridiales bacterium]
MSDNRTVNKPSLWIWKIFYIVIALAAFVGLNFLVFSPFVSSGLDVESTAVFLAVPDLLLIGFLVSLFLVINQKVNSDQNASKAPLVCMFVFLGILIFAVLVVAVLSSLLINSRAAMGF